MLQRMDIWYYYASHAVIDSPVWYCTGDKWEWSKTVLGLIFWISCIVNGARGVTPPTENKKQYENALNYGSNLQQHNIIQYLKI